jgi:lysine N6-hydroxylase
VIEEYDAVAVGCGPFNLGLAALASELDDIRLLVLDGRPELTWHRGLMFGDAMLQVPFLADLVSLVEPAHPLSFLSYLRDSDRLYQFYVREQFHPTRREYESYLRWCASRLDSLRFGHEVTRVSWDGSAFVVDNAQGRVRAGHLVIGVGTEPALPEALTGIAVHSGDYLYRREELMRHERVTVVGSGQSGAECVLDLLRANVAGGPAVGWLTRTPSFAPLDYSKLVLEMTTPSYVDYFHGLEEPVRDRLVKDQWRHYKGISTETLDAIHDVLYDREVAGDAVAPVELRCGVAVEGAARTVDGVELTMRHADSGRVFTHRTDAVVAATGYRNRDLPFLADVEPLIQRDAAGRWALNRDHSVGTTSAELSGRIFVSNADLHSHGVAAPDLGIGAIRNATILNSITGRECFRLPKSTAFTTFAAPG